MKNPISLKIPRRRFLSSSASLLAATTVLLPRLSVAQQAPKKRLFIVTCNGGWDVTFHLDPKPTGLPTVVVPAGNISTLANLSYFNANATSGSVANFFTNHVDVTSIVRGISVRSIAHEECIKRMLTGTTGFAATDIGALTASVHAPDAATPYLTYGAISFPGTAAGKSARVGASNQLATAHNIGAGDPGFASTVPNDDEQALINAFLSESASTLKDTQGAYGLNRVKADDAIASVDRVQLVRENKAGLGQPFAISTPLSAQIDSALNMMQQGAAFAVNVSTGFVWDTHDPPGKTFDGYQGTQGANSVVLFTELDRLFDELKTRDGMTPGSKMIDDTVVIVVSEMTRTPLLNGDNGKDHWPYTSALVAGGGVVSGHAFGATDDSLIAKKTSLTTGLDDNNGVILETDIFIATLMRLVGLDETLFMPGVPVMTALLSS